MRKHKKKALTIGLVVGLGICVFLLVILPLVYYDGKCDINIMGGERYECNFSEFLLNPRGLLLYMGLTIYAFWWLVPIIVGATMLTMYGLTNHNHN